MGMKKLARKRLFDVEKKGIDVDVGVSDAMKPALVSATQHREGYKVVTDLVYDFGAPAAALKTKALATDNIVGPATGISYLCQVTQAVFGVVTKLETVCLEALSDGTLTDYDLLSGDAVGGTLGTDPGSKATIQADIASAVGNHELVEYNNNGLDNKYLYLTSGNITSQKATAIIDCTNAVTGNVNDGVDTIRLINSSGVAVEFVATGSAYNSGLTANKFHFGGADSNAKLAEGIQRGINNHGDFTAALDGMKVNVTHSAVSATSNHTNYLLNDDPQASNEIEVGAFTGGIDDGVAITSGKFLLRLTGFMEPSDL